MSSRFVPKGEVSRPPPDVGKTFLVVGACVFAGLSGFYLSMLHRKRQEVREGTNPIHEQVLAHFSTKPIGVDEVKASPSRAARLRALPMTAPTKEHNAKHITLEDFKASPDYSENGRYQVPSPQRPRGDGSGRVYTKSPDYVRNYEKTNNRVTKDSTGREART